MEMLEIPSFTVNEWQLFMGGSKSNLKCMLLHNQNLFGAVWISYSVYFSEEYEDIKEATGILQYHVHEWIICVWP